MASEREQTSYGSNPFINPMVFWQNYMSKWIEVKRGSCDNAIKVAEYWFKKFWDPWLRGVRAEQKETARVE
jgi:predicted metal-dependent hydrolase